MPPRKKRRYDPTDLVGARFGRLVLRAWLGTDKYRHSYYHADCDCGTKDFMVLRPSLVAGRTKSCGCFRRERAAKSSHNFKNNKEALRRANAALRKLKGKPE